MKENTINALSVNVEKGATGIHYCSNDETMEITTADRTLMTKIRHIASKSKNVVIDSEPNADNGGFMLALVPVKYLSFKVPHTRVMTDEQKKAAAERLKKIRKQNTNN